MPNQKQNKEECDHNWGYKTFGGFPGHEHEHITGGLVCFLCEISLEDFIFQKEQEIKEKILEEIEKIIKTKCDEKIMPRIWNLDKDTIEKFIKVFPFYEPKSEEEYQVGFIRGETWGALKLKIELQKALQDLKQFLTK